MKKLKDLFYSFVFIGQFLTNFLQFITNYQSFLSYLSFIHIYTYTMSFPECTIFQNLITTYDNWVDLSRYLASEEGGRLRIEDISTPFALIRYVKGQSDLTKPHVRALRSVVWDTVRNRPVSVTPFKSADGEHVPRTEGTPAAYDVQMFWDGVMIGVFWDSYNNHWRLHTRSTLDATCRYYSQTKTFQTMFWEAAATYDFNALQKDSSYTFVLQHPENRIVCDVAVPRVHLVEQIRISDVAGLEFVSLPPSVAHRIHGDSWKNIMEQLVEMDKHFKHNMQGFVVKDAHGKRWKIRTVEYNRVRKLRGNSARRDFLWLSAWRDNTLSEYLTIFPEERRLSENVIQRWKRATNEVFHLYTDVFKSHSLQKLDVPPKYRPLVYALHKKYLEELKPTGRAIDWKYVLHYMNDRDVAQMIFVINWDLRLAAQHSSVPAIPVEPHSAVGTMLE